MPTTLNGAHRHITRRYRRPPESYATAALHACVDRNDPSRFIVVLDLGPGLGQTVTRPTTLAGARKDWRHHRDRMACGGWKVVETTGSD